MYPYYIRFSVNPNHNPASVVVPEKVWGIRLVVIRVDVIRVRVRSWCRSIPMVMVEMWIQSMPLKTRVVPMVVHKCGSLFGRMS